MSINPTKPFGIHAALRGTSERSDVLHLPKSLWRVGAKALRTAAVLSCVAVLSSAQATIKINEYPLSQSQMNPWGLTAGPDGAIWFTESCPSFYCGNNTGDAIGRITSAGVITEFPLPVGTNPYGIATGPDGALWFTELTANKIGRITTSGVATEYSLPTPNGNAYKITAGPDGALWFTEGVANKIGRITTAGLVTEYPVEGECCSTDPTDIVAGPDGALWFTNLNSHWIGRISTQADISKYPLPIGSPDYGIVAGPDNALWFTGGIGTTSIIWRITTDGMFSMFDVPTKDAGLSYITLGRDNALWFTENYAGQVGRVTTSGVFTEYPVGGSFGTGPVAITTGPDGAVWFGKLGYIEQILLPDSTPPVITLSATPRALWPPSGRMVPVAIFGTITDTGSGVNAKSSAYAVRDEYGEIQPKGAITLGPGGNYSFTILLQASRLGTDSDGRRYTVTVRAQDNAGNGASKTGVVTVPHDKGN